MHFTDTCENLARFVAEAGDTRFSKDMLRLERVKQARMERRMLKEKKVTLQEVFGWATNQMSSMEGCLLISPSPSNAKAGTAIDFSVVPNESGEPLHEFIS